MSKDAATHNTLPVDVKDYTETVTRYIEKITVIKTITTRAIQKPSMTAEVGKILRIRDAAFRVEDKLALRSARSTSLGPLRRQNWLIHKKSKTPFVTPET